MCANLSVFGIVKYGQFKCPPFELKDNTLQLPAVVSECSIGPEVT